MLINDAYKTYIIEETDDCFMIEKNNDKQYYEVLETINQLSNDTFCVLNHLFVNEGREEMFEDKFLQRDKHLQDVPGFKALRFLRPKTYGRHYIIVTLWEVVRHFMIGKILENTQKHIKNVVHQKVSTIRLLTATCHIM